MRRFASLILLGALVWAPAAAFAQADEGPVVDVVEVAGIIDRPIARYILERIDAAEREGAALLVLQLDSLGGLKVDDEGLALRVAGAAVPTAVFVGPRRARAAGLGLLITSGADVVGVGPSTRVGPVDPIDHADPAGNPPSTHCEIGVACVGFSPDVDRGAVFGANAAVEAGLADVVVPSLAELLRRADGRTARVGDGSVTLDLPEDEVTVRFFQPGPLRRLLHTFSNPTLVYLLLIGGALLVVFELFQPGFGVAGVTGALLLAAGGYGLTVLPARAGGLALVVAGLALLAVDVAIDGLGPPTILGALALTAGSFLLYPQTAEPVGLSAWVAVPVIAGALIFFVPVMTVVRRARKPIATAAKALLIGESGQVRSMLNPEGFVLVDGEVWRARSTDGTRMRVGEDVIVERVDGTVLVVRGASAGGSEPSPNGARG